MTIPIRQSVCRICGKEARPGSAIVLELGAGGRVHKQCFADEQTKHQVTTVKQEPVTPTNKV